MAGSWAGDAGGRWCGLCVRSAVGLKSREHKYVQAVTVTYLSDVGIGGF